VRKTCAGLKAAVLALMAVALLLAGCAGQDVGVSTEGQGGEGGGSSGDLPVIIELTQPG